MPFRTLTTATLVAAFGLFTLHGTAEPASPQDAKPAQPAEKTAKLSDLLAKRISLEKPFEGKFKEAIAFLADRHDLPIILDPSLREVGDMGLACDGLEDKAVKLPKLMNVRTETVLRMTCEQADAMFLVYPDYLRIVPSVFGLYETGVTSAGTDPNDDQAPLLPAGQLLKTRPLIKRAIVNLTFKSASVADILDEIAATSGANVALAPLVGEKGNVKLNVRFANTPVDAAVRTVCEMSDLAVIEDANVLVVTTPERAAARAKAEEEKKKVRLLGLVLQNPGLCANGQVFFPNWLGAAATQPVDATSEITKLKEQNEQLKKQLDEVLKSFKK
jgi:hypothetical protein